LFYIAWGTFGAVAGAWVELYVNIIFFDFWGWWASVGGIVCCDGGILYEKNPTVRCWRIVGICCMVGFLIQEMPSFSAIILIMSMIRLE